MCQSPQSPSVTCPSPLWGFPSTRPPGTCWTSKFASRTMAPRLCALIGRRRRLSSRTTPHQQRHTKLLPRFWTSLCLSTTTIAAGQGSGEDQEAKRKRKKKDQKFYMDLQGREERSNAWGWLSGGFKKKFPPRQGLYSAQRGIR